MSLLKGKHQDDTLVQALYPRLQSTAIFEDNQEQA